jgi:hypothetical protein
MSARLPLFLFTVSVGACGLPLLSVLTGCTPCLDKCADGQGPCQGTVEVSAEPTPLPFTCSEEEVEDAVEVQGATVLFAGAARDELLPDKALLLVDDAVTWSSMRNRIEWRGRDACPALKVDFTTHLLVLASQRIPNTCGMHVHASVWQRPGTDIPHVEVSFVDYSPACEGVCLTIGQAIAVVSVPRSATGLPTACASYRRDPCP